jgi:uncharacterized protein
MILLFQSVMPGELRRPDVHSRRARPGRCRRPWAAACPPGCDDNGVSDPRQVTDNQAESRFELAADGQLAELLYRRNGKRLVLIHTEVPAQLEGRGIGGALVEAAVDRAAREGMTLVPLCPFARGWLERHPDVASRAAIDWG